MKRKYIRKIILSIVLTLAVTFAFAQQRGPVEPPPGGPTGNDPPVGGEAPIGGGTMILLVLGAAYSSKKVFNLVSESDEQLLED